MQSRSLALVLLMLFVAASFFLPPSHGQRPIATSFAKPISPPSPREVLGFNPGDDRKLASWNQILQYFEKLDQTSDRVKFEALGKTTMDKPFAMATISAPENLARLEEFKKIQEQLYDPRTITPRPRRDRRAAELIKRGKTVVLITCGIHSTEVGSTLSSMLIAHRLATSNEPEIQQILRNTIVLLVPSLNPDGVDIVKNWYDKTLGTPFEGTSPPELYHKFTGHDNNRDWYAFTQVETQITVDKIHNVWHPQIVHDIHQQGANGSRLFLPPYMAPVEPNVPKQIVEGYTELGNFIAREMRGEGFKGISTNSTYDAWSPARAYSHYHGGVRILSETASARIATPIKLDFGELRGDEGYDAKKESRNFGPLWQGGEWRLTDITTYMTTAAFTLLKHAAQNRERWLSGFFSIGKEAVRSRQRGELWGFELLQGSRNSLFLERTLERGGVELSSCINEKGTESRYVSLAQPAGAFAKALLEKQRYPDLRDGTGHPIVPYDVTAHTLSLMTDVQVKPITAPFKCRQTRMEEGDDLPKYTSNRRVAIYKSHVPSMDEGWTRWVLQNHSNFYPAGERRPGNGYSTITDEQVQRGRLAERYDVLIIPDQSPASLLTGHRPGTMPREYSGGLGEKGVKELMDFVEAGGTLITLNRASNFAIQNFKLPVRDVVNNLPKTDFFVPGSILRIELDAAHSLSQSMQTETIAWVEDSPVFEVIDSAPNVQVVARYPSDKNPLLSGWLLGEQRVRGKAALVEVALGKGRIILFGFRPQYRAQTLATYPLLFNAINAD